MQKEEEPTTLERGTTLKAHTSRFLKRQMQKEKAEEESTTLKVGTIIRDSAGDQYVVEGLLGQGGFGAVYLVRDRRFKRSLFALKEMIDLDKHDRERFIFEGEVLERLHHWALPHVYRVFRHQKLNRVYMLMDYVQGKNLRTLRKEQTDQLFSLPIVLTLMAPVVDALIYLHHQEPPIVHCDIKPANIIVSESANETMLVDFGLAKEYVAGSPTRIVRYGSPGYAAPEQYGSGTTPRTDIYGLGATFYTLLTGVVPVDAITRATENIEADPVKSASAITPDIPEKVGKILQRAMNMCIEDRFSTVEEFWQELIAFAPESLVSALPQFPSPDAQAIPYFKRNLKNTLSKEPQSLSYRGKKRRQARRLIVFLASLCLFLLAGIIGVAFLSHLAMPRNHLKALSTPRATAIPSPPVAPTSSAILASITGTYQGNIIDDTTNSTTTLTLKDMHQNKGHINGFLAVGPSGPAIPGKGALSGTIDNNNYLEFIVLGTGGQTPLFFEGTLQALTLRGDFYSCGDVDGNFCSQIPGSYGTWIAAQAP